MIAFAHSSAKKKLIWLILLASVLALLTLVVVAIFYEVNTLQPRLLAQSQAKLAILEEVLSAPLDFRLKDAAGKLLKKHCATPTIILAALYDTKTLFVMYRREGNTVRPPPAPTPVSGTADHEFTADHLSLWWPIHNTDEVVIGYLYLLKELPPRYARLPEYTMMSGAVLLALAIAGFILVGGLGRYFLRPLATLVGTARQIIRDSDYSVRTKVYRQDELGELAKVFNQMLAAIQHRDEELTLYRHHLEELVKTRTSELLLARDAAEAASRAKGRFLANMSHEIRTPMSAVLGLAKLLDHTSLSPIQRDYVDKIMVAGQSLLAVINSVLDYSKIEANRLELESIDFRLLSVLDEVASILSVESVAKHLELVVQADPLIPQWLKGDPLRLRQILVNLAGNAIKFTASGSVRIAAELADLSPDRLTGSHPA